jgi:flagellar basal-body rod protein FlgF
MDRLIYTSMSGAIASMHRQSILSSNLANASTPGFRAELTSFEGVAAAGEGQPTRIFALANGSGYDNSPGSAVRTGRNLDVMAANNAWFAVQGLDGIEAYTKSGSFTLNAQGDLVTAQGLAVLDDGGAPINVPNGGQIEISSQGQITLKVDGQPPTPVARMKLVTPAEGQALQRGTDGLFRGADGQILPNDPLATVESGVYENSNVNPIESMVAMIQAARQFDAQMRLIQSAETNDKSASQLLTLS